MPTGSRIVLRVAAEADVPTPDTDQVAFFADSDDSDAPAWKDDGGTVHPLTGGTGPTGPGYGGTSTTSLAIGTGSKAFTTQAGLAYVAGSRVRAASDADPDADWMEGVCTAYSGTTLTVLMDLVSGSGTHTDWNLSLAGEQGPVGAGVAPTVVAHGAMGATETFDYGDGPAHSAEADAACTWTFSGATAGEVIMTIYLDVDSGGPYAITLPAAVANKTAAEAFLAAVPASTSVIIPFVTIDSGTTWTAMLDVGGDLDSVIAASSGQDIADALAGAAAPDSSNVFATMADVGGGGGLTHAYLGYNTIGGTTEAVTVRRWYAKKITVATAGVITSIGAYLDQTTAATTTGFAVGLFEDNAGTPRYLLATNTSGPNALLWLQAVSGTAGDPRWVHMPLGFYVPAGDYWIGVTLDSANYNVYKDGSGSDRYWTHATGIRMSDAGIVAITTTTDRYSIRASIIT